jgi:L-ascorbate metabolism protein UlaG (beta-lactamase superfamily)
MLECVYCGLKSGAILMLNGYKTMRVIKRLCVLLLLSGMAMHSKAHQRAASAMYLGNEAILVSGVGGKVLFDPFFHKNFGVYQLVPDEIKRAIIQGEVPYDNINAIVVSHAHGDHFAAEDVLSYLLAFPRTKLIGPKQAVDQVLALLKAHHNAKQIGSQMHSIDLVLGDAPVSVEAAMMTFEAVRIPHSGWPGRADIQNIVFRVTLGNGADGASTVMHMGDADADDGHYLPYKQHWQERETDMAFPPYWFYASAEGNDILQEIINARQSVGVHVPVVVPRNLKNSAHDYFSRPGEQRNIGHQH